MTKTTKAAKVFEKLAISGRALITKIPNAIAKSTKKIERAQKAGASPETLTALYNKFLKGQTALGQSISSQKKMLNHAKRGNMYV